jgi:hypothetical protein
VDDLCHRAANSRDVLFPCFAAEQNKNKWHYQQLNRAARLCCLLLCGTEIRTAALNELFYFILFF